jgi:hypothetical protein
MKKNIILLLTVAFSLALSAQNENENKSQMRSAWFDFQFAQHIGLSKQWSSAGYVNEGLPGAALSEFRGTLNLIGKHFGFFADMGVGFMPAPRMKSLNLDRLPMPNKGTQYYLREVLSESDRSGTSAHFKMTFGLVGRVPTNNEKLTVIPYFGLGFLTMPKKEYDVILKEDGSNMQYQTTFIWKYNDGNEYEYDNSNPPLGYLNGRLNFRYKRSQKTHISLGLEYTWYFSTIDFYAKYTNTFNANVNRSFIVEGNRMNMLAISLGISL